MRGKVLEIFICSSAGLPMQSVEKARAIEGAGLEGDRYALEVGAYSKSMRRIIRHVSLISEQSLQTANAAVLEPFSPAETRRNILVQDVPLNDLVGKEFSINEVRLRGVELCDPCERPSGLSGKKGFLAAFQQRGGLRAEIVSGGEIKVGDPVSFE